MILDFGWKRRIAANALAALGIDFIDNAPYQKRKRRRDFWLQPLSLIIALIGALAALAAVLWHQSSSTPSLAGLLLCQARIVSRDALCGVHRAIRFKHWACASAFSQRPIVRAALVLRKISNIFENP
jgi:hypothetical protein